MEGTEMLRIRPGVMTEILEGSRVVTPGNHVVPVIFDVLRKFMAETICFGALGSQCTLR